MKLLIATALTVTLAGCGSGSSGSLDGSPTPGASGPRFAPASDVGSCPAEHVKRIARSTPLQLADLAPKLRWVEAGQLSPVDKVGQSADPKWRTDDVAKVRITSARAVRGAAVEGVVVLPTRARDLVAAETANGAKILLGFAAQPLHGGTYAMYVVSIRPDDTVAFLGYCQDITSQAQLAGAVREWDGTKTEREALEALIGGEQPATKAPKSAAELWAETPAAERFLDPERTPADVLSRLKKQQLTLDLPVAWRSFDLVFCTRNTEGWNECVRLDAYPPGQTPEQDPYVVPGQTLEMYLFDGTVDIRQPLVRLGDIPTSSSVRLVGDTTIATREALLEAARNGRKPVRPA